MKDLKILKETINEEIRSIEKNSSYPFDDIEIGRISGLTQSVHFIEMIEMMDDFKKNRNKRFNHEKIKMLPL